jgi:hypothetical protein
MSLLSVVPLLIVLAPTGESRDGLPVYRRHPDQATYVAALSRGFSGRLLRLYRWEQQLLAGRDGSPVEPAYLLLSNTQGGFPRFGFWLDGERKAGVGYVDLHQRQALSGQFGAMDQIFPHELIHVIVRQLAKPPPPDAGGANQVHAIGVRTDRITAFDEGFAEHVQVLAVDDPDALPATHVLAADAMLASFAADRLSRYRRALDARWALAPPARLGFVLWFSQTEQILRYHAVKANVFAHEVVIPPHLLDRSDRFAAYLLENTLPGSSDAAFKRNPRLFATEGVIAALFSRWVEDPAMQQPAEPALYDRFGITAGEATPIDHAYLKLFAVLADQQPHDAVSLVRGYVDVFPRETAEVANLMRGLGFTWPLADVPEIWLANDRFPTGTTLFDQYRAVPRTHTFDLNAASLVDLMTVDGISRELATAIQEGAPYASLEDAARVRGMTAEIMTRVRGMAVAMMAVREANAREDAESIDLMRIFRPVLWRAILYIICSAMAAGWLYGRVRRTRIIRLTANGAAASVVGLFAAWLLGAALQVRGHGVEPAVLALAPLAVFGLPGALWQLARYRSLGDAARVAAAWAVACLPGLLIAAPML